MASVKDWKFGDLFDQNRGTGDNEVLMVLGHNKGTRYIRALRIRSNTTWLRAAEAYEWYRPLYMHRITDENLIQKEGNPA